MKCPVCLNPDLVMTERQGVEIDYCPQCRGIWLDRGELDKIIDRASAENLAGTGPAGHPVNPGRGRDAYHDDDDDRYYKHRRKKSFLGEIFDF